MADGAARGLDHVVLAVHDLDDAAATWERLGFTLTPTARHPWGTHNRLVPLDGSFLEILGIADASGIVETSGTRFSFGAFNRDYLAGGEGASMLVLESRSADGDLADYRAHGLPAFDRFDFERIARQPDGSERKVGFSLAITALTGAKRAGFFSCQQHYPQNFWKPAYQVHANGARALAAVIAIADVPADHAAFLRGYSGGAEVTVSGDRLVATTPRGRIEVLTPDGFAARFGAVAAGDGFRFGAVEISVGDVLAAAAWARRAGFAVDVDAGRAIVPAAQVHGVALAFAAPIL